jgi:hypothetical protein
VPTHGKGSTNGSIGWDSGGGDGDNDVKASN